MRSAADLRVMVPMMIVCVVIAGLTVGLIGLDGIWNPLAVGAGGYLLFLLIGRPLVDRFRDRP